MNDDAPDRATMVAAVEAYMQGLCDGDLEAILALYAEGATVEDPVGTEPHAGLEALRTFYTAAVAARLEARLTGPVRTAGPEAAFPFEIRLVDMDPPMRMQIIDTFRFDAVGKVVQMRAFWGPDTTVVG